jgi:hypothetical protein
MIKNIRKHIEHDRQEELRKYMHTLGWATIKTHGNAYQKGLPDLYCSSKDYGQRWIELKKDENERLTRDQIETFGYLSRHGTRIWILRGISDYNWLFKESNWQQWLLFKK